ncbi:CpsD/CapB family tyrosine-protein kinase [Sneathiella marina]|uniref:CpsD/CapB family tyrosine-protein kinase n=1 Tax=Sneathiella marina TaxID=2950108 RepID=A0ABY4W2C5_9PROT|nr:CpsD/CapB family tyrosine-protein kinase [Sneathiella marina]USG61320.1 CpsD/CapB family tyrosine-protein kinase [Sneathiella marina]
MERIKEAIAKAKEQNPDIERIPSKSPTTSKTATIVPESGDIKYQQTRVVDLDMKHLEESRIITLDSEDPNSISFDILRTQVLAKMEANNWRTLAITSPTPECGKTVVSINLALSIAKQTDYTALLADFDLRRPRVGVYLGLPDNNTLSDYLDEKIEFNDALVNPGIPRFVVLQNHDAIRKSTEILTSPKVKSLVMDLRDRYEKRICIFDLPPLLSTDDSIAFIPQVDCILLVVASGETKKSDVTECRRQLQAHNLLGVVFNKSDEKSAGYYY